MLGLVTLVTLTTPGRYTHIPVLGVTGETAESETGPRLKLPLKVLYTYIHYNIGLASWDTSHAVLQNCAFLLVQPPMHWKL